MTPRLKKQAASQGVRGAVKAPRDKESMNIIIKQWTGKKYKVVMRAKDMYLPAPDVEVSSIHLYPASKRILVYTRKRHD